MKKILNLFFVFVVLTGLTCNAQTWQPLDYSPDQLNLEENPLKGLTPLYNVNNNFPHSIRGRILSLRNVMLGIDNFNWSNFDNFINNTGNSGSFSYLQVNIDTGQAGNLIPNFLENVVPHFYYQGGTNPGDNGISQLIVDYNDPEMMAAMLNFIQRFGERYNNDPRVYLVHYGLYGVFGEWDMGYGANEIPNYGDGSFTEEDWAMTEENQRLITAAFDTYFSNINLLARFPENVPEPQDVGYSDGLYFGASISENPQYQWFFYPKLVQSNADLNWKKYPIGGEMDPDVQPIIWNSFPNTVQGLPGVDQETDAIFEITHPTFIFQDHMFNNITEASNPTQWNNAIKATKKMGYTFYVNEYKLSASGGNPAVEVNIQNTGLAPMYADWEVELGYLATNGDIISLGTTDAWNLRNIQPEVVNNYRSFISGTTVPDGTHTVLLRVVNPLAALIPNPANAKPVRFANTTQDIDELGWLTLGDITIAGGEAGNVPVSVASMTVTPETAIIGFNSQLQLAAAVLPANATNPSVTWSSNRPGTASVDENGLVTTNTLAGDVIITAYTEDGGIESMANITVESAHIQIPSLVEAERFTAFNNLQVNPAPADEGGVDVLGFIGDDTWMEYEVVVSEAAEFILDFRASSFSGEGIINILNDTGDVLGTVALTPQTGNYDIYDTYRSSVINLPAGQQTIRLDVVASSFNLNWIDFILNPCPGQDPSIIGTVCDDGDPNTLNDRYTSTCDCAGIPAAEFVVIPSLIQAEDYYQFSNSGEQINTAPSGEPGGGNIVGFINDNTWLEYAVTVTEETDFLVDFRASNPFNAAQVNILNEVGDVLAAANFSPSTNGDYDTYLVFTSNAFVLPAGNHVLRIDVVQSAFNINWLEFRAGPCSGFDLNLINTPCDDGDAMTSNDRYTSDCGCEGMPITAFVDIPSLIQAEDYYDVFNVQVNPAPSGEAGGGDILGFIADNTWMDYAVSVAQETEFELDLRASSPFALGVIDVLNETGDVITTINLTPGTNNSYDIYDIFSSDPFTLPAGDHRLRLDVVTSALNLNWIEFRSSSLSVDEFDITGFKVYPNPVSDILYIDNPRSDGSLTDINIYDIQGRLLYKAQTTERRAEINIESFHSNNMLFVKIGNNGQQVVRKVIVK